MPGGEATACPLSAPPHLPLILFSLPPHLRPEVLAGSLPRVSGSPSSSLLSPQPGEPLKHSAGPPAITRRVSYPSNTALSSSRSYPLRQVPSLLVLSVLLFPSFPGGSDGKESTCNARDPGSVPGSGRSPGERNGNPLQSSCPGNPMDRRARWAARSMGSQSQTRLEPTEHACPHHSLSMDKQSEVQRGQVIHPRGHRCGGRPRIPSQALESTSTRIETLIAGVPNLCDLVPDDLRWSRCNSNRNKVHNKFNHPNHPQSIPPPRVRGKTVFHEAGPRCQRGGDPWVEPPRSTAPSRASHSPLQGRSVVFSGESSSVRVGNPIFLVLVLMCSLFIDLKMFLMEHPLKECGRGFPRRSSGEDSALS